MTEPTIDMLANHSLLSLRWPFEVSSHTICLHSGNYPMAPWSQAHPIRKSYTRNYTLSRRRRNALETFLPGQLLFLIAPLSFSLSLTWMDRLVNLEVLFMLVLLVGTFFTFSVLLFLCSGNSRCLLYFVLCFLLLAKALTWIGRASESSLIGAI